MFSTNLKLIEKIKQRPDLIIGVKVAHYEGPGWEPLDRGVESAKKTGTFVMVDQTPIKSRPMDKMMLNHLNPGDIVTHCYGYSKPMIDRNNKVHKYFYEARKRVFYLMLGMELEAFLSKLRMQHLRKIFSQIQSVQICMSTVL